MDPFAWIAVGILTVLMIAGIVGGIIYLIIRAARPRRKGRRAA